MRARNHLVAVVFVIKMLLNTGRRENVPPAQVVAVVSLPLLFTFMRAGRHTDEGAGAKDRRGFIRRFRRGNDVEC